MNEYYEIVEKSFLFNEISSKNIRNLLVCLEARVKVYKNDEYLFFAGDKIIDIGIVLEGHVEIIKESLSGERHIVAFVEKPHMFAEGIVSTKKQISPVTTRAKAGTRVLWIPYSKIIKSCGQVCDFHIKLINNIITILGEKNVILNNKIELLTLKGMREKLTKYLLNEEIERGTSTFSILLNRAELADYLNVSRTSMCRELSRMKDEGIIDYYGKSFKIINKDYLVKYLEK